MRSARPVACLLIGALLLVACGPDLPVGGLNGPSDAEAQPPVTESAPQPVEPGFAPRSQIGPPDSESEPPEPPEPPESRERVVARLEQVMSAAGAQAPEVSWAALVVDEHGRRVLGHREDAPMVPASTLKVVTAAAALQAFGPDHRFATHVEASGTIDDAGRLRGDLLLVGDGDPTLSTDEYIRWVYPARPATRMSQLADMLVARGLRVVHGDVVGASPYDAGPALADGWLDRYLSNFDSRHHVGLTVDAGLRTDVTYEEVDADHLGTPTQGTADGHNGGSAPGTEGMLDAVPADITVEQAVDPAANAAHALEKMLVDRGVTVIGVARSGDVGRVQTRLATVHSPPLSELVEFALEFSDNHLADAIFRALGRRDSGIASWDTGAGAVLRALAALDVDASGAVLADGSGLSRVDRLSVRTLVDLDRRMVADVAAEHWIEAMAQMGRTGTLRNRLRDTVADGAFHGKTGSLRDVMSISGAVLGPDDRRYHLALVANDVEGVDRWVARAAMDEIILLLSADLADCDVEREPPDGPGAEPGVLDLDELVIAC